MGSKKKKKAKVARKVYSKEEQAKLVKRYNILRNDMTAVEAAESLGVSYASLRTWSLKAAGGVPTNVPVSTVRPRSKKATPTSEVRLVITRRDTEYVVHGTVEVVLRILQSLL